MSQKAVLITDYVHPALLEGLDSIGLTWTYAPEMSRDEMEKYLPFYEGVVINTRCAISGDAMQNCPSLKWIARLGSGLDIIDLETAAAKNIKVLSAPEGNAQAVAEHAAAMLLSLSNKIITADQQVRQGLWLREQNRGFEISGRTIGIIGYGNNGSAFGQLWKGWNVKVLAYDKYLKNYADGVAEEVSLEQVMLQSDIISLHIPLTEETKGMINEHFIRSCRKGIVLINTSRGKVVELTAVVEALESGQLGGACLDVLPYEPPSKGDDVFKLLFTKLTSLDNVVLSPHVAGWTVESKRKIAEVLVERIREEGKKGADKNLIGVIGGRKGSKGRKDKGAREQRSKEVRG